MPSIALVALFGIAYVAAAGIAQLLAVVPGTGISLWPPSGLFIGTLIVSRPRSWPWWIITAFLAEMAANFLWFHNPLPVAALINAGNAAEAVVGAVLVRTMCRGPIRLESLGEVAALVLLGAGVAPLVSATVGAGTLWLFGMGEFARSWTLFWVGDATGALIFTPLVIAVVQNWSDRANLSKGLMIEATILGIVFLAIGILSLGGYASYAFFALPPLLWAALRFQATGAAVLLVGLAVLQALMAAAGSGLLFGEIDGTPVSDATRHILLQMLLSVSAISALIVAALSKQRHEALETLKAAKGALEARVAARTAELEASERRLAAILEALPIGVGLIDREGHTVVGNPVLGYFGGIVMPQDEKGRLDKWEGYDERGHRIAPENFAAARALRGERVWPGMDFLFHGDPQRGPIWTRRAALPFLDAQGKVIGATLVISDIDQEKRARDALRESEERLRLAQEAAGLGVWEFDFATGQSIWSAKTRELVGLPPDAPASSEALIARVVEEDRPTLIAALARLSRPHGGRAQRVEFRVAVDGGVRWLETQGRVEVDRRGRRRKALGVIRDITERKAHEQQTMLLMREVNHRSKNVLSLVMAIARQTAAASPGEFFERFGERVRALAGSQDLLIGSNWKGVGLRDLIVSQLAHFKDLIGSRIEVEGPPLQINASAAQTLGMALHELGTNAAKYGALTDDRGHVSIAWALNGGRFTLAWSERGGPEVRPGARRGFGTTVLETMCQLSLGAGVRIDLEPTGLRWRLDCRADRVLEPAEIAAPRAAAGPDEETAGAGGGPALRDLAQNEN